MNKKMVLMLLLMMIPSLIYLPLSNGVETSERIFITVALYAGTWFSYWVNKPRWDLMRSIEKYIKEH